MMQRRWLGMMGDAVVDGTRSGGGMPGDVAETPVMKGRGR